MLPEWLDKAFDEEVEQAQMRVIGAKSMEELWAAKGRLDAAVTIKTSIELAHQTLEQQDKERLEGIYSHGN